MIVYHAKELSSSVPRAHPWTQSIINDNHKYIDFKKEPEKIRTSIEDLAGYKNEEFSESFFQLLEWINGSESILESNDCAFIAAINNTDKQFKFKKRCSGRIMILFRELEENTQSKSIDWLFYELMLILEEMDGEFKSGVVGFSFLKTVYMQLSEKPKEGAQGFQLMLSMFAYGKNRSTAHKNMNRIIKNLHRSFKLINARILAGEVNELYQN